MKIETGINAEFSCATCGDTLSVRENSQASDDEVRFFDVEPCGKCCEGITAKALRCERCGQEFRVPLIDGLCAGCYVRFVVTQ